MAVCEKYGYALELVDYTFTGLLVAVQDLTKMSDIIRSRTYEAFFPLIVSAIIYFALELLLVSIVKSIQIGTDNKKRKPEKILKGIRP